MRCWSCDTNFIVTHPKGHEVTYCPFCSEIINTETEDIIKYEEEDDDV
jgi:hypothetical protein